MDIKSHSTMMIAMAIAVVIVTSVMVPVITDTLDNNSGGDGGVDGDYVNKGEYYLKKVDGDHEYDIYITDNTDIHIDLDGESLFILPFTTGWVVPFFISELHGEVGYLLVDEDISYVDEPYKCLEMNVLLSGQDSPENFRGLIQVDDQAHAYIHITDGIMNIELSTGDEIYSDVPVSMILSDEGEYVYSKSPIVDPTSMVYLFDAMFYSVPSSEYRYFCIGSYAPADKINDFAWIDGSGWDLVADEGLDIMDSSTITVSSTVVSGAVRLDKVEVLVNWYLGDDSEVKVKSDTFSTDMFLVPVHLTHEITVIGGWEESAYADISLYTYGIGSTSVGVYTSPLGSNSEPIYVQDLSQDPVLLIAFSSDNIFFVDVAPGDGQPANMKISGWGEMNVFDYHLYTEIGNHIDILGGEVTLWLDQSSEYGPHVYRNISDSGHYELYYNRDMPSSENILLYMFCFHLNMHDPELHDNCCMELFQLWSPPIRDELYGTHMNYNPADLNPYYSYNWVSNGVTYTMSGDLISGVEFDGYFDTHPSQSQPIYLPTTYSMTGQSAPIWGDSSDDVSDVCIMFGLSALGEEETDYSGSGGGSSLPSSLVAMITAIPLIVIAGLVLVGVGMLRKGV